MSAPDVQIRPLRSPAELDACVALQQAIWGPAFSEGVPASLLVVVQRVGGVAAGAFDATDRLLGFVFGITGPDAEGLLHWSDMLGVAPEVRGQGIARRLKEWQADTARRAGATRMQWSFDPLQARNAWLNLVSLGARVIAFVPDMYPGSTSPLHAGGTDRLLVEWRLDGPAPDPGVASGERVEIGIPATVESLDAGALGAQRLVVRHEFMNALGAGYRVIGFERDARGGRYVLTR